MWQKILQSMTGIIKLDNLLQGVTDISKWDITLTKFS